MKAHKKIANGRAGFPDTLDVEDLFGHAVAPLGDLDDDGLPDLAVGAFLDDDGGTDRGAVWILFLNSNGTVKAHQKLSSTEGSVRGLDDGDLFSRVTSLPDVDGDGVEDLAVGAPGDDDGGDRRGAMWVLFLNTDGTVKGGLKISDTRGGFTGVLDDEDRFGWSGAWLGDHDGDGHGDLAVGALFDGDGGFERGAVWVLFLNDVLEFVAVPGTASPRAMPFAVSPNPFRSQSTFEYALSNASAVRLLIFDARGRRVTTLVDRGQAAGFHSTTWSGRDENGVPVGAGIYFARLEADGRTAARKIVLLK